MDLNLGRFLGSVVLAGGVSLALHVEAIAGPIVTVGSAEGAPGTTVTIPLDFTNPTDEVVGFQFDITFDTANLTPDIENCGGGSVLCSVLGSGDVRVLAEPDGQLNPFPDGSLGSIDFEIAADETLEGTTLPLEIAEASFSDDQVQPVEPTELNDGSIDVVAVTAVLTVQPPELNFGSQQTGTTSGVQTVTVSNDGEDGIDLEISSINITGDFDLADGDCSVGTILADGEGCSIDVTFSPSADGPATGSLVVGSDAGEVTNDEVELTGEGVPSDANLVIQEDPGSFDFPDRDINEGAFCQTITLENTGTVNALTVGAASVDEPFSVSDSCNGVELGGGQSCVLEVCFDPENEDDFSRTLEVTSDANTANATLTGTGTAVADLQVTPEFGPVNLGTGLQGETLTRQGSIENVGSADATVQCDLVEGGTVEENLDREADEILRPSGVFSTTLPLNELTVIEAGADPISFQVSCALPEDAEDGDTFSAEIQCNVDDEGVSEDTTHFLSCGVSEFEPLPVPTMSNWSIALFAMLMLLVGGISIRFFRT